MENVVNCAIYDAAGAKVRDVTVEEISDILPGAEGFVWIGLHEPGRPLLQKIQEEFNLHPLAVEDAQHAHQRPKIETYGNGVFIALKTAQFRDSALHFGESHLFLGRNYLISVRHGASTGYAGVRARCEQQPEYLRQGSAFALYAIIDQIVDNYVPAVDGFENELSNIEHLIFEGSFNRSTLMRLYDLRRELVDLRLAVVPIIDICNQLARFHEALVPDPVRPYFRDIADHAMRINEAIDTMREMLTGAMDVNVAMVTIRQNEIVKKLAGWAAILALPTLVASIYGMNFEFMPELKWRYGYPVVLLVTCIGVWWLFRRLKRSGWI